ncbi:MAG: STAS domain-containing protein [Anaerolineae bacterium]
MEIKTSELKRVTLFEVAGRIDSTNANELGEALNAAIDAGRSQLVIDLKNVEYMSSAGLRELVNALKKVKRGTGDLRLASVAPRVMEVLELSGLDTIFEIYDSQVEAVGSF